MENCGGGQRLPPDGDEFPAAYQEFSSNGSQPYRYIAATRTATITANGGLCNENEPFRGSETFKMLANDSNVVGSRSIILSDSKITLTSAENVRQDVNNVADVENVRSELSNKTVAANVDNGCHDTKSSEAPDDQTDPSCQATEDLTRKSSASVATSSLYSCQTNNGNSLTSEKKTKMAAYYHKDVTAIDEVLSHVEKDTPVDSPPPLPLTGMCLTFNSTRPPPSRYAAVSPFNSVLGNMLMYQRQVRDRANVLIFI